MHTRIKAGGVFGTVSKIVTSLIAGSMLMFGCGGGQENDNADSVERTVVRLNGDGEPVATTLRITVAQQRAEIEARQRKIDQGGSGDEASKPVAGIYADSSCGDSSLWVFDGPNLTGNEICFYGGGQTYLFYYTRVVTCSGFHCLSRTWDQAVRSYWAGVSGGAFYYEFLDHISARVPFTPWQIVNYASDGVQRAYNVELSF